MKLGFYSAVLSTLLITGCAPTIGNNTNFSQETFTLGITTKFEVSDTIGLPNDISKSKTLKQEYWAYQQESTTTGVQFTAPSGGGTISTYSARFGKPSEYEFKDAVAIYVFDSSGILIDVRDLTKNK